MKVDAKLTYTSKLRMNGQERNLTTKKKETISIFPFICSNIPAQPAYEVYIF